ncbi:MAG: hypothetical protein M0P13_09045 [Fibrobacteraceae bacterium]|nr:hypothetical protein [Fibrobacteraceae bacterium]
MTGRVSFQTDLFGRHDPEEEKNAGSITVPLTSNKASRDGSVLFTYGASLKKSIRFRSGCFFSRPEAKLPKYMGTPEFAFVRELIAEWVGLASRRKTAASRKKVREVLSRIWNATDRILLNKGVNLASAEYRLPLIKPEGRVYNLNQVFAAVNAEYFDGALKSRITWSSRTGGLSFHTVRRDPLSKEQINIISISRGYDFENCPLYAVSGVVYHECLHIAIPPQVINGRRVVHGKNFRQRERLFTHYQEWIKWHSEILPKNVRVMNRVRKNGEI